MSVLRNVVPLVALTALLLACSTDGATGEPALDAAVDGAADTTTDTAPAPDAVPLPRWPQDETLRLNEIQVVGTHNSYHVATPGAPPATDYTHRPLGEQLAELGVRQLELDVFSAQEGEFSVYHMVLVDQQTNCETLPICLAEAEAWSAANPDHVPLLIIVELKVVQEKVLEAGYFEALDALLLAAWPRERVLTPDDVRGAAPTLREALTSTGWPTLARCRGKALFVLNTTSARTHLRMAYLEGHPTLEERVMFVRDGHGEPWGAVLERGDALRDEAQIRQDVLDGYLVRTAADSPEDEDDRNAEGGAAALRSGAHFISTDFPEAVPGHDYVFPWPSRDAGWCNPVSAPAGCDDGAIALPRDGRVAEGDE